jgi:hypothetical protein
LHAAVIHGFHRGDGARLHDGFAHVANARHLLLLVDGFLNRLEHRLALALIFDVPGTFLT